ncbi:MAG TPA: peptidase M61 [Burkholderiaceae bacterium]|nr:peptidase M61 [Burkholderiaceae bacterium]
MTPTATHEVLHYLIEPANVHAHLYRVTLTLPNPEVGLVLSLPVWIPGSYLVREFAQHLQRLSAEAGGVPATLVQRDKHSWAVTALPAANIGHPLQVSYEVYAFDASVRTAWLDATRGFFNGTSLCLRVAGREQWPHHLTVARPTLSTPQTTGAPATWQVATGLAPLSVDAAGFGTYAAPDYDTLIDSPVEMGPFWKGSFAVRGTLHEWVVAGAGPTFDGERLLADTQRICEAAMDFWHGPDAPPPFERYVFMLWATHNGYGGLEHRNSTALICPRADLPRLRRIDAHQPAQPTPPLTHKDGYTQLLGLISHEYFHTWNVKRLRPAEFRLYDLNREQHTALLWFFEGFTSYYDDLLLLRAGLIDTGTYLSLLAKAIDQVAQTPGRQVQTVAEASFDAWTKYYRVQENTPNATVSYYTKGSLVALCLDLTLRQHGSSLDHLMRALWQRCGGGPMSESDVRTVAAELAGRPLDTEIDAWVHSTAELPVQTLLSAAGVNTDHEPQTVAQSLGLRVAESNGSIQIKNVLRGSAAETAGLAAGDEWVAIEHADGSVWRLHQLDDLLSLGMDTQPTCTAWISRDRRMHRCPLTWPSNGAGAVKLSLAAPAPADLSTAHPTHWPSATR